MVEEIAKVLIGVFAPELVKEIKHYIQMTMKYKGKCLKITLKSGLIRYLWFVKYSDEGRFFTFRTETNNEVTYPLEAILCYEILDKDEIPFGAAQEYSFSQMKYTLKDFPTPFISPDGIADFLIVFGEGSRDCSDYIKWMKTQRITHPPTFQPGRRGDFDYTLSLGIFLGYVMSKRSSGNYVSLPYGRQGFMVTEEEKKGHNLILIGSGAVNSLTKEIFNFYGEYLPVRFSSPNSDDQIISDISSRRIFSKRYENEANVGLLAMLPSPYNKEKLILIAAGLNVTGTQAALLALCDSWRCSIKNSLIHFENSYIEVPIRLIEAVDVRYEKGLEITGSYHFLEV